MGSEPRLANKAAVITGANQGIGAATARAFAAEGARLCLLDRKTDGIGAVAEAARGLGAEAFHKAMDVTDPEQVEAAMRAAQQRFGRIDVLVNCAGVFHSAPLVDYRIEDWNRVMAVNVTGVMLCCQAALKRMVPQGYGKIVNLASLAGKRGDKLVAAYSASKHAVIGITRCAALEAAEHGITVNAICPGYVNTDMYEGLLRDLGGQLGQGDADRFRARMLKNVPLGRMIEPEEIAALAVYLASPESDGMTGQALSLAGGMLQG